MVEIAGGDEIIERILTRIDYDADEEIPSETF
jgi:hypothetical protein